MTSTIWLASYPKSGNTWFRMLVANLRRDTPVDINDLPERSGISSARGRFDAIMLFPSGLLTHEECDRLRPQVYAAMAAQQDESEEEAGEAETAVGDVRFIKSHDAYIYIDGVPLMGGSRGAAGAILIVRDPRDVAPSLANHNGQTVDEAIAFMASPEAHFCGRRDRQHNQLRQQLPTWGGYNAGWLDQSDIPLHLVRYEDLQRDTAGTLIDALGFAGVAVTRAEAEQAARFADFGELKKQEGERGFREAPRAHAKGNFFRRGIAGAWHDELSPAQVSRIEHDQAAMMTRLGYAPAIGETERMTG